MSKSKISPMSTVKATRLKNAATTEEPKAETVDTTASPPTEAMPVEAAPIKTRKAKAKSAADTSKKLSCLDAAAKVLAESGEPMNTKAMIEAMAAKKLWSSPNGKTPSATLYSAILREIDTKKAESRFRKADKGLFASNVK